MAVQLQPTTAPRGFRILLDSSSRKEIYRPGDVLKGRVSLRLDGEQSIGVVNVQFWGRCKTKVYVSNGQGKSTYRGRYALFTQSRTLYKGHYTHKSPAYEWPFEFTFPAEVDKAKIGDWQERHPHFVSLGEPGKLALPPTFSHSDAGFLSGKKYDCFIEYKLEASVNIPNKFGDDRKVEIPLHFSPALIDGHESIEDPALVARRPYDVSSYSLDPAHQDRKLTVKEGMKSFFGSSSIPYAKFSVLCHGPRKMVPHEPSLLSFQMVPQKRSPSVPEPPTVTLQSLAVKLSALTWVRSETGFFTTNEDDSHRDVSMFRVGAVRGAFEKANEYRIDVPLIGIREMSVAPTFKSPNISRSYQLEAKAVIDCAGKSHHLDVRWDVQLLPERAHEPPPIEAVEMDDISAVVGENHDDGVELPSYKEAITSA